jgi:hypothetical protein
MRIVIQVFATLMLVSLMLGCLIMAGVDFQKADEIASINNNVFGQLILNLAQADLPSEGAFRAAGLLWLLVSPLSIAGIVFTFLKKHQLGWIGGAVTTFFLLLAVILQPSIEVENGNDPKYTGYGVALFGLAGLAGLVLVHTVMKPKVASPQG